MNKLAKFSEKSLPNGNKDDELADADEDVDFKPLSTQEAAVWRTKQRRMSVWRVLGWQLSAICLMGVLTGLFTRQTTDVLSAVYGGLAVVLPASVMAWGLRAKRLTQLLSLFAKGSLLALFFWEGVKIVLSILMLALAPVLLKNLNWLALVAGFVLVIKVYWLALFIQSKTS